MLKTNECIKYIGSVTIKEYNGNKLIRTIKTHNGGTSWLFKVLALALTGSDLRLNMPHFLDMGYSASGKFLSVLSSRVGLTSKVIESFTEPREDANGQHVATTYGYSAIFTATIPAANIISTEEKVTNYLLTSKAKDGISISESTVLAEVIVEDATNGHEYQLLAGYTYVVEWVMTFANLFSESAIVT